MDRQTSVLTSPNNDKKEPTILVTGSTGFVGRHLVKSISEKGKPVIALYHHKLPEPLPHVIPLCLELNAVDSLTAALRGIETVVYLAWDRNFIGPAEKIKSDDLFSKEGKKTKNIYLFEAFLRAAEKAEVKRLIFTSANGASRQATPSFLLEKYWGEQLLLNSNIPEKIIIRPNLLCGGQGTNGDKFVKSIVGVMKYPLVYPVPRLADQLAPVHIGDFVDILINLIGQNGLPQKAAIIEATGAERFKIEDLFKLVSAKYGVGVKMQIRGRLGHSLVPLFEKSNKKKSPHWPALNDFLMLSNKPQTEIEKDNPIQPMIPKAARSFKEALGEPISTEK